MKVKESWVSSDIARVVDEEGIDRAEFESYLKKMGPRILKYYGKREGHRAFKSWNMRGKDGFTYRFILCGDTCGDTLLTLNVYKWKQGVKERGDFWALIDPKDIWEE